MEKSTKELVDDFTLFAKVAGGLCLAIEAGEISIGKAAELTGLSIAELMELHRIVQKHRNCNNFTPRDVDRRAATRTPVAETLRCEPCDGTGTKEYFSEQAWDFDKRRCHHCKGTGIAAPPTVSAEQLKAVANPFDLCIAEVKAEREELEQQLRDEREEFYREQLKAKVAACDRILARLAALTPEPSPATTTKEQA